MVHIFERETNIETLREEYTDYSREDFSLQVSYNSDGHLCLRFYKKDEDGNAEEEFMVSLTERETRKLFDFCRNKIA